jgi:ribosomal-protein-alanine N-acetyltransferase
LKIITETPRIIIREFALNEQAIYLNHFEDVEVTRYLPVRTTEERIGIFRNALEQYSVSKNLGTWGMFHKASGDFIGSCLLRPFNTGPGVIELGYSIEKKYWGLGIGTEMATAMIIYGFSDPGTLAVVAVTTLENTASKRVLKKAGLKQLENLLRDGLELAYFKLTRDV